MFLLFYWKVWLQRNMNMVSFFGCKIPYCHVKAHDITETEYFFNLRKKWIILWGGAITIDFLMLLVGVYIFILWLKEWATNLYKPLQSLPTMKQISRTICCVKDTLKQFSISPKHQHIHANPYSPTCTFESDGVYYLHSSLNHIWTVQSCSQED